MLQAGGNEEELTKAKATFSNAVIGFFLVMAAFLLLNWVLSVLTGQPLNYAGSVTDAFKILETLPK